MKIKRKPIVTLEIKVRAQVNENNITLVDSYYEIMSTSDLKKCLDNTYEDLIKNQLED